MSSVQKRPLVVYVEDDPTGILAAETLLEDHFELRTYSNAIDALKDLKNLDPWAIVSDQRMPQMTGLQFLEIATQLAPDAPRILVTGQTDEQTMIKLVRFAKLFDYITKPIIEDELVSALNKAVELSRHQRALSRLLAEKDELNRQLQLKTDQLERQNRDLESARVREVKLRQESEAWSGISAEETLKMVNSKTTSDETCIVYDIIGSRSLHGKMILGTEVRNSVVNLFTSALLKYGGLQENHGGDAAFGHFGAFSPGDFGSRAFAVAREFRVGLRTISELHKVDVECGIAIHLARKAIVTVHSVQAEREAGGMREKKFLSSSSPEIDVMFRLEKLTHKLAGSNILLTEAIATQLNLRNMVRLGYYQKKYDGVERLCVYLVPSDRLGQVELDEFKTLFGDEPIAKDDDGVIKDAAA